MKQNHKTNHIKLNPMVFTKGTRAPLVSVVFTMFPILNKNMHNTWNLHDLWIWAQALCHLQDRFTRPPHCSAPRQMLTGHQVSFLIAMKQWQSSGTELCIYLHDFAILVSVQRVQLVGTEMMREHVLLWIRGTAAVFIFPSPGVSIVLLRLLLYQWRRVRKSRALHTSNTFNKFTRNSIMFKPKHRTWSMGLYCHCEIFIKCTAHSPWNIH